MLHCNENRNKKIPTLEQLSQFKHISNILAHSKCVPSWHYEQGDAFAWTSIFACILQGFEVGMPIMASVKHFSRIGGTTLTLWGDPMLGLIRGSGTCEFYDEYYDEEKEIATAVGRRVGMKEDVIRTFSMQEAVAAGLDKKDNYKKYKVDMLKHRAGARVVKFLWPDILMGLNMTEEFFEKDNVIMNPVEQILLENKSNDDNLQSDLNNIVINETTKEEVVNGN